MTVSLQYCYQRSAGITEVCIAMLLSGCAVGPNYKRPVIDSPVIFRGDAAPATNSFGDVNWWTVYQDPILQALIREALTNNYDLLIAASRVEQERALAEQARSQFVPNLEYNGTVSQGRNVLLGSTFPNNGATSGSALISLNSFWELDLWGRIRRLNEGARARLLVSKDARNGVMLSLLSDVASDYFRLLELDRELEIDTYTANSFADSLKIFQQRMEGGAGSALETSRAGAALADANSATPLVFEEIAVTENELFRLAGSKPGAHFSFKTRLYRPANAHCSCGVALSTLGAAVPTSARPKSYCARLMRTSASPWRSFFQKLV